MLEYYFMMKVCNYFAIYNSSYYGYQSTRNLKVHIIANIILFSHYFTLDKVYQRKNNHYLISVIFSINNYN